METLAIHGQTVPARTSEYDSGGSRNMIGAAMLNASEGIYARSVDCKTRFEHSIQILKELNPSEAHNYGYDRDSSLFAIQDIFAHFKAWGNSIAAFQDAMVRTSLEFRLKEASEIQRRVLKILGNLQVSLHEATLIITGEEPNEWWPIDEFSDSENKGIDVDSEQTSELQELFKAMKDANVNLMKLSMVIRNSPNRDDYLKAATRYRFDPNYDIGHVREKHGSAEGITDWLIVRLGKAITRRRQYLKYREDHHGKLTRDWDEAAAFQNEDRTIALTKATTFVENTTVDRRDGSELDGSFGSQTSYEDTVVGETAERLNVPSHPKMAFEDVPFEFGSPFRCPYCFTEQVVKNRSAWKKHVFRDLRPYVCTFKECDMRMFRSRNEWFAHELQNHRREWVCQQCHNAPFSSSSSYKKHLRSMHHVELEGSQLKALILQSEEPIDKVSATGCRLCDEWKTNIEDTKHDSKREFLNKGQQSQPYGTRGQFRRHLGRHMEQLALFALPINEDIMEDDSLSNEEDHEESSISNINHEHIGNEHPGQTITHDSLPGFDKAHRSDDGTTESQSSAYNRLDPDVSIGRSGNLESRSAKAIYAHGEEERIPISLFGTTSAQPNQDLDQEMQKVDDGNAETRSKPDNSDEHISFLAKEKDRFPLELEPFGIEKAIRQDLGSFSNNDRHPSAPKTLAELSGYSMLSGNANYMAATLNDDAIESVKPSFTNRPQTVTSPKDDLPKSPVGTSPSIIQEEKMTQDFKGAEGKSPLYVQGEELERPVAKTKVAKDERIEEAQTSLASEVSKERKDAQDFAEVMEAVKGALDVSQDVAPAVERINKDVDEIYAMHSQSRENIFENPSPIREDEAPLQLDDTQLIKVLPDARWTKIDRRLVNPEALETGKERFEVIDDFVLVLRVLTKKEVLAYADETQKIRIARGGERNYEAASEDDEDRGRHRDRDRYKDHQ